MHRVAPEYPMMAAHAQVEGVVILEATVNPRGRVDSVHPFVLTVTVSFNMK